MSGDLPPLSPLRSDTPDGMADLELLRRRINEAFYLREEDMNPAATRVAEIRAALAEWDRRLHREILRRLIP